MTYTIDETISALKSGEITSVSLVKSSIETFEKDKESKTPLNAFLEIYPDALAKAEEADKLILQAKKDGTLDKLFSEKPLLGLPFAKKNKITKKTEK